MTIFGLGEVLLRLTPPGYTQIMYSDSLNIYSGGAELNTLKTLSHFNHKTEMITTIPKHDVGEIIYRDLLSHRVGTSYLEKTEGRLGLYYMENSFGNRSGKVIYDRDHSTFTEKDFSDFNLDMFKAHDYVILTGITLAVNHSIRKNIKEILKKLKEKKVNIVFDINYRETLWSLEDAVPVIESVLEHVDILFYGKKDATHLLKTNHVDDSIESCAKSIQQKYGIEKLVTSNRDIEKSSLQGMLLDENNEFIFGERVNYNVLNRIGAGDAFVAGILHGFIKEWDLQDTVNFATKCSALQHTTLGDALVMSEEQIQNVSNNVGELSR